MKKWMIGIVSALTISAGAWAAAATGMPALDDLLADVKVNGPISRKVGFSDTQRERIQNVIEEESERLVKLRDELVSSEKKVERKDRKNADMTEARDEKSDAARSLNAAREESFNKLAPLMSDKQFNELKQWRAEGKGGAPDKNRDDREDKNRKDLTEKKGGSGDSLAEKAARKAGKQP